MMGNYRFSALIAAILPAALMPIVALIAIPAGYGQSKSQDSELSVEQSYLQEDVDLMIIRETSNQDGLNQKLLALDFIGSLIEQGNTGDEIRLALERLSLEGTNVQVREKGRLKNDYPEVRRLAVKHLGSFATDEAKIALIRVCAAENEPLVLQEAIRSLGIIGIDKDGDVVGTIVWVVNRYHNSISPDSHLAIAAIDALNNIAKNNNGVRGEAFQLLIMISEGAYPPPIREKARQTIMDIRGQAAKNAKDKKQVSQPR